MVQSMLKTENIPATLQKFLQAKLEGNPFYIEEVVNALIESQALIRENGGWKLTRPINTYFSSPCQGWRSFTP